MNAFPSEQEFLRLAETGNLIPVCTELMADFATPVSLYARLSQHRPAFLFESIVGGEQINRYSFAGCSPRKTFAVYEEETLVHTRSGTVTVATPPDPLTLIEEEMARYRPVPLPGMPPFTGGAVGFCAYEYIHRVERSVPRPPVDELGTPLLYYMLTDSVVVFDHARQVLRLIANAHIEEGDEPLAVYEQTLCNLRELDQLVRGPRALAPIPLSRDIPEVAVPPGNFTREQFEAMVEREKEYIRAGDCIQIVGSQRFRRPYQRNPLDLYRALRVVNPSPYMFIVDAGDFATVGASPEVHVRLTGSRVEVRPIAGTRPRGASADEDLALEHELLADEKERAEHLMLVDLARNDIGRVCRTGTVEVKDYATIERYSHVMHIVSQVEGTLSADRNAYDLMRATFPAGTVSGAPKVRAMQIISELEGSTRGPYAGALGYFSYDGNLDTCIAIRTALLKDGELFIQSGGGHVVDSVPANEYQETLNKAKGMLRAVDLSERIGDSEVYSS